MRVRGLIGAAGVAIALSAAGGCGDDEEAAAPTTTVTTGSTSTSEAATTTEAQPPPDGAGEGEVADEAKPLGVADVLEAVLTGSADPTLICDELATENYVRSSYGAREGCIAAQKPGALADSLNKFEFEIEGMSASATVVPNGGPYDGVDVEVELVRDGESWRVDSLLADIPAGP